MKEAFEYTDHDADVGVRVTAASLEGIFEMARRATMAWIGDPPAGDSVVVPLRIEAPDVEALLVQWLQEHLFLFQHRALYSVSVPELVLGQTRLQAGVKARPWSDSKEFREVKAVTYHQLEVRREGGLWRATFVLDV